MTYDRAKLEAQLEIDEERKDHPYRDSKGIWTAGVGHNLTAHGIDPRGLPTPIPDAMIDQWLEEDIGQAESDLDKHLPWWRQMTDARQRALMNLCFNMGWGTLSAFRTMLAALQSGDYTFAADDLLKTPYARQVGGRASRIADLFRNG